MIGAKLVEIANLIGAEDHHFDDQGYTTHHPWLPEQAELIYGTIASLIVFFLLWKYGRKPAADGMKARTSRIQQELDDATQAKTDADAEAARIRQALGDIQSERQRLLAEADAQAESLLTDGRARLEAEVVELEAKADADIQAGGRAHLRRAAQRDRPLRLAGRRPGGRAVARRHHPAAPHRGLHREGRSVSMSMRRSERQRATGQLGLRGRGTQWTERQHGASASERLASHGLRGRGTQWTSVSMSASDARIDGYARGLFEVARAEGTLDEVEDELFRFARSYESSEELRTTLGDDQIPAGKRQSIVEDLLGGKATPTTVQLVSMVIGAGRARDLPAIVDRMVQRAASSKDLEVAEVRTAVDLTPDQQDRLKAALANATGKNVTLKVVVDPTVLGGIRATVGDTVIDGSVRTNLDQLKSRL